MPFAGDTIVDSHDSIPPGFLVSMIWPEMSGATDEFTLFVFRVEGLRVKGLGCLGFFVDAGRRQGSCSTASPRCFKTYYRGMLSSS